MVINKYEIRCETGPLIQEVINPLFCAQNAERLARQVAGKEITP